MCTVHQFGCRLNAVIKCFAHAQRENSESKKNQLANELNRNTRDKKHTRPKTSQVSGQNKNGNRARKKKKRNNEK